MATSPETDSLGTHTPARPRAVVLAAGDRPHVLEQAQSLRPLLERHLDVALWDMRFEADLAEVEADWAVVLGGDGSILRAARQMGYRQLPVIGVNLGKLGFLADILPEEFPEALPKIVAGGYRVVEHLMFECRLERDGREVWCELGLNEVSVHAGPPFAMLEVELFVDSEFATTYSGDGLILSTAVGSTAHSLAAGGPILRKDLDAFVISPISPHTLTNRPVVDSASRRYELRVPRPNAGTTAVIDGRRHERLSPGDRLSVVRAAPRFRLVEVAGQSYYRTLRRKLGWGGSLANRNA